MMDKTKEMDTLMKARLADFKKRASRQQQKVTKESTDNDGQMIMESSQN